MKYSVFLAFSILFFLAINCTSPINEPAPPGPPWIVYTKSTTPLVANHINYIALDSEGKLWFATDSGANSFSAKNNSWGVYKDSLKSAQGSTKVTSIAEAKDRSIWFGILGGGAVRFNSTSQTGHVWTRFTALNQNELLTNVIYGIAPDKSAQTTNGEVWLATNAGINLYHQTSPDLGTFSDYTSANVAQLTTNFIVAAETNPIDNHIWFGLYLDGLVSNHYDANLEWESFPFTQYNYRVNSIAFDRHNTIWVGKELGAASLDLTSGSWQYYVPDSTGGQFPRSEVHAVTTDLLTTTNTVRWFGTDSGLVRLSGSTYTRFTSANSSLPNNKVTGLKYDLRGNLWIGTVGGVAVYNEEGTRF